MRLRAVWSLGQWHAHLRNLTSEPARKNTKRVWKKTDKRDAETQMGDILFRKAALAQLQQNESSMQGNDEVSSWVV